MDNELSALTVIFTEFYCWVTVVMMFLIHVGFCLYEVGVSREKNKLNTLMKNSMLIPVITVAFFLFGWWIYFAFQNGPGITGGLKSAPWAEPWNELMGPHLGGKPIDVTLTTDQTAVWSRLNGVFWAAFLLFSRTAGSILSGAVIVFFVMGFVPCYVAAWALKKAGVLRIPREVELAGMDHDIIIGEAALSQEYAEAEQEVLKQHHRDHQT